VTSTADLTPPGIERFLERHRRRVLVALLVAAGFVRLLLVLQLAGGPLTRAESYSTQADDHFFHAWGRRIADGDLLQREPWHPMTRWMRAVAGQALAHEPELARRADLGPELTQPAREEALWTRWMRGAAFYQEPGYPYLVGATYRLFGPEPWGVFAWQLLLGVGGVWMAHALARKLFSRTAGLAAGVLAVLAPVPLFYEVTLLRDALVAYVGLGLACVMAWAAGGGRWRHLVLGVCFGAAALVKETFLVFPLVYAGWRLATVRVAARERLASAGVALAGIALALLPAVIRNVIVGAPALTFNGCAAPMLPVFHTIDAQPLRLALGPAYAQVLASTDGNAVQGLLAAARSHPSIGSFLSLELQKLAYVGHAFEAPNNVDFYLFRQAAPVLAWLPARVVLLVPLAAVGLSVAFRRSWPLFAPILAGLGGVVLSAALSRYRAPVVVALVPLAGAGLVQLAGWVARRRALPVAFFAALSTAYVAWAASDPPRPTRADRAAVYRSNGLALARSHGALATLHLLEAHRLAPGDVTVDAEVGRLLLAGGEPARALPHLTAAVQAGAAPAVRLLRARALIALAREDEALAEIRAATAARPAGATGPEGTVPERR